MADAALRRWELLAWTVFCAGTERTLSSRGGKWLPCEVSDLRLVVLLLLPSSMLRFALRSRTSWV